MAKKTKKKKAAKKAAKKSSQKSAASKSKSSAKSGGKKAKKSAAALAPQPVKTGKGASVSEVAQQFMSLLHTNAGEKAIWDKLFHKQCVSIEGGMNMAWNGLKAMQRKADEFYGQYELGNMSTEGPYIGATGFAVKYTADIKSKADGQGMRMSEVGVYSVKKGKVVQEEFMNLPM